MQVGSFLWHRQRSNANRWILQWFIFLKEIKHLQPRRHFMKGTCISTLILKCNMPTLLVARHCGQNVKRSPTSGLPPCPLTSNCTKTGIRRDPKGKSPPSPHKCMSHLLPQSPGSRQFNDPWFDTPKAWYSTKKEEPASSIFRIQNWIILDKSYKTSRCYCLMLKMRQGSKNVHFVDTLPCRSLERSVKQVLSQT